MIKFMVKYGIWINVFVTLFIFATVAYHLYRLDSPYSIALNAFLFGVNLTTVLNMWMQSK